MMYVEVSTVQLFQEYIKEAQEKYPDDCNEYGEDWVAGLLLAQGFANYKQAVIKDRQKLLSGLTHPAPQDRFSRLRDHSTYPDLPEQVSETEGRDAEPTKDGGPVKCPGCDEPTTLFPYMLNSHYRIACANCGYVQYV